MKRLVLFFSICLVLLPALARQRIPPGCTVISVSKDDDVFFGGNDDYINPDSYYWVEQGDSSKYGVIWIGTPDNPQQGVNEQGLAYDSNGLPRFEVNPHTERTPVRGNYYHNYVMQIMHECSTVKEVIDWVYAHQRFPYMHDQLHFADKTGDAVIISAGKDGELVFTRKASGDSFLVSTNFNVANPSNGYGYPCWRFDRANELLGQIMNTEDQLDINDVTTVMDAVHQEGASWTIETFIADLVNGVIYLYYFYQFDSPVIINVKDELINPREAGPFSQLFPENVQQEAANRYKQLTRVIRINNLVGRTWLALLVVSMVLLFIIPARKKEMKFWIPAVFVLGPVALLIKILIFNKGTTKSSREALIETAGNMIPVVVFYLVAQVIIVLKAAAGSINQLQQVILIFGLPLLAAWIIFHTPLLAIAGKKNPVSFLIKRLPQVLVVTFLGLAGIFPVAMPLENMSLAMSQIIPLSPWIVLTWWAITVAGSLVGGTFVFIYEHWAVKRGFKAWNIFTGNGDEIITPGWRNIWWWIIISIIILVALLVASVYILQSLSP